MQVVWEAMQKYGAAEAAKKRFSIRTYDGRPLDDNVAAELAQAAQKLSADGVRIVLNATGGQEMMRGFLGTRGKIEGVCAYASFVAKDSVNPTFVGYIGEAFVLVCTALGLGTVWIGGTMDKKKLQKTLAEGEKLYCVTPIGIAAVPPHERKRMTLEKLTDLSEEKLAALQTWQKDVLECVRIAPSAMNKQPWRCNVDGDNITVHTHGKNFGFEAHDTGIARLHRDIALLAAGKPALGYEQ